MAFKSVAKGNYDAGNDMLDQIPPEVLGGALGAIVLVFFIGLVKFMRKSRS